MLTKRLIACLIIKDGWVVQSINFERYLPIGRPEIAVEFLNQWGIDEIVLLDIDATKEDRGPDFELIKRISKKCFVPLTVGGGIKTLEEMKKLIRYGADKICLNASARHNATLLSQAADVLGNQCIVASVDVIKSPEGKNEIYSYLDKKSTGIRPLDFVKNMEKMGAGEIFLNMVNRDGKGQGYDLKFIKKISSAVSIPVIACGGAGSPQHFYDCLTSSKIGAIAASNYFHFTEHSPISTKQFLKQKGVEVRLDTHANYDGFSFDQTGRVAKQSDQYLDKIRFIYEAEEII